MARQRVHNEWFMSTQYGVCDCGSNKRQRRAAGKDLTVYAWGEYSNRNWHTIRRVCEMCFQREAIPRLLAHAGDCGCEFALQPRMHHSLPPWITLVGTRLCTLPGPYLVRIGGGRDGYRYATTVGMTHMVAEAITLDREEAWMLAAFYPFGTAIPQSEAA